MTDLRQSPLHAEHESLGASFTPFGPWNMPLKYQNELDEHRAVRASAGIFDLSHMGEIRVSGPEAGAFLDFALISMLSTVKVGKAKYSMLVDHHGGILDDLISYRLADDEFLVVPNAGNTDVVWEELRERSEGFDVRLADESLDTALVAVQGPASEEILAGLVDEEQREAVRGLKYYSATPATVAGAEALVARTGYTGEDGFEIYLANDAAVGLWRAVLEAGQEHDVRPAGLAARDSLRLEAGMPLYGNELGTSITPVEAGMARAFTSKEIDFVGREQLAGRQPDQIIAGLVSEGRRAARAGSEIFLGDRKVGVVTSGQPSPTLGHPIALALLEPTASAVGTALEVDIRGKRHPFVVAETPFYRRAK